MGKCGDKASLKAALLADTKEFAEGTTAHGVAHLVGSRNWVFRVIWLCLLAGAWAMICIQVYTLYNYYRSYPVNAKVEIVNEPLTFPFVTICNHNAVKRSKIRKNRSLREFVWSIQEFFSKLSYEAPASSESYDEINSSDPDIKTSTIQQSLDNSSKANSSHYDDYWGEIPGESEYFLDPDSFQGYDPLFKAEGEFKLRLAALTQEEMKSYSADPSIFIMKCSIGGRDCSADDFVTHRDYDYGICHTFPNPHSMPKGIKTYIAGPQHGLHLILNIEQKDYVPFVTPGAGVRVAIHKSPFEPYPYESGFSVQPGTETSVSMKMEHITRQPYPYGDCDEENRYSSFGGCMRDCLERLVEELCFCTRSPESMYRVCRNETEVVCTEDAIQKLGEPGGQELCRKCTKPCKEFSYRSSISSAYWPSDTYESYIRNETNEIIKAMLPDNATVHTSMLLKEDETRKNLLKLNIFYGELYSQRIKEEKAYEIVQLASDIGGQMGLWAGVSVLTIAELIELMMLLCKNIVNRVRPRRRDVRTEAPSDSDTTELKTASHGWVAAPLQTA